MAKALCPKCKTVLEQPVPQCPACGVRFKAKAPAAAAVAAPSAPPRDEVFETIFGDEPAEAPPAPVPAPRPAPRPAAAAPAPAAPAATAAPAQAFDHDAARVFAEAFTARRESTPAPEPERPAPAPVYEEPAYVPHAEPTFSPFVTLKEQSLHPKVLIPGFLFFFAATHMFMLNDGTTVSVGLVPALGAAAGLTLLTLAFDYWRFSR